MSRDEFAALVEEIAAAEGISPEEARVKAQALADEIVTYVRTWDHLAALARPYEYVTVRTA